MIWIQIYVVLLLIGAAHCIACPNGCLCANNMIVCACTMQTSGPTLGSFQGMDYISKIYIHSCNKLVISADTFSGLSVGQEMTIMNVDHLVLEPYAFRNMLKYPAHFTIKDSGIDEMGEHSLSGFSNVVHMWFRNVTIGAIRSGAFRHVSHVEYIYFRESTVHKIDHEAFSFMSSVAHFYIRGKMKIGEIHAHIFRKSSIANIMFEEVLVNRTSAYAFVGATFFSSMQFQNCTLLDMDFEKVPKKHYETENGQKIEFIKTNAEKFSLACLSHVNHVRFEESQFDRILGTKDLSLNNVSILYFIRTGINILESGSLSLTKNVQSIMFDDCAIETIQPHAINGSSGVGYLIFMNSKISKLEKNSFSNAQIETFIIDGCDVNLVRLEAFGGSKMALFKFVGVTSASIEKFALSGVKSEYCGLENNKFNKISEKIFDGVRCENLNITDNTFNLISEETFGGAVSFGRLTFNHNKFSCQCKSSYLTQLLAFSTRKESALNLGNNFCLVQIANRTGLAAFSLAKFVKSCKEPRVTSPFYEAWEGLICHRNFMWTNCKCKFDTLTVTQSFMDELKNRQTSGLTFSECSKIRFETNSLNTSEFSHIIVDHSQVEFEHHFLGDAPYLRTFTVRNCTVKRLKAKTFAHEKILDLIEFQNSSIDEFEMDCLKSLHVKELRFVNCKLGEIRERFAAGAKLENLTIHNSEIGRISNGAFNNSLVATLRVTKSTLIEIQKPSAPEIFYKNTFVCFIENKFSCQCDMSGSRAILDANGCDDTENICSTASGNLVNKKLKDIFNENLDLHVYKSSKGCFDEPYTQAAVQQSHSSSSSNVCRFNLDKLVYLLSQILYIALAICLIR